MGTGALVAATVTAGLMAGLFAAFAYAVMPGLGRAGDATFVEGMQKINVAILNGWFGVCFGGALVFSVLAAVLHRGAARPWIVAGAVLYLLVLVVTMAVNVPLNDKLEAAGRTDPHAAREAFETVWVRWNVVRAVLCTAAFGCLSWALVLAGRAGG
ncbi:MAG TPA: anthrone oxygenase family protein [Mycobacteriales bacterium]|nr:anthrone oxygenase family protein [Mycobacteriales bacterium]